ncbi:MAG: hypothetical protein FD123_2508 [Bacteroidetes bacterium]|nr:MAG: hypothetical protein FD123_2508 [Bacteroidota bacterium]
MSLRIEKEWKIADVKKNFSSAFPFLRIEILRPAEDRGTENESTMFPLSEHLTLAQVRDAFEEEQVHIHPAMRVSELADAFARVFGLKAKVLRKAGKHWLETNKTDHWTLSKQNQEGESLSGK